MGYDKRWKRADSVLALQLLSAARAGGAEFSTVFAANFLGHEPQKVASLRLLLWGTTAAALRRSQRQRRADIDQLAREAAATAAPDLLDPVLFRQTLTSARLGAQSVPDLGAELVVTLRGLYTVCVSCNSALDNSVHSSVLINDSWHKRYKIYAWALRFQVHRHDRKYVRKLAARW